MRSERTFALRLALSVTLLPMGAAAADDAPSAVTPDAGRAAAVADAQQLIVFAPQRPIVLRLHIMVDRQPAREQWNRQLEAMFLELDDDGDGRITVDQAVRLAGVITASEGAGDVGELARLAEGSQTINLPAIVQYVEKIAPPILMRNLPGVSGTSIFAILDADGDHRLSRAELQGAAAILRRRDFNDDEVITADELVDDPAARPRGDTSSDARSAGASDPVLLMRHDATAGDKSSHKEIAAALLAQYDRDGDGLLRLVAHAPEIMLGDEADGVPPTDGTGRITAEALADYLLAHADVECSVSFGAGLAGARDARVRNGSGLSFRRRLTGDAKVEGRGIEIDLLRDNRKPDDANGREDMFTAADTDGNRYLDEAEYAKASFSAGPFAEIDADHDGKIYVSEITKYLLPRVMFASSRIVLRVTDGGQDLFDLLDGATSAAADRQLSIREILAAPQLLAAADRDGDGFLAGDEITQRYSIELVRAGAELLERRGGAVRPLAMPPKPEAERTGPDWFLAMDHNQDGDLSAREFLGPASLFAEFDANHDGLIDAAEAAAGDKR